MVKCDLRLFAKSVMRRQVLGAAVALTVTLSAIWGGAAYADPSQDTVAQLNDLSQQAEQLAESMKTAQRDLDAKVALLREAERKHADDLAALTAANTEMAVHQGAVDKFAAAVYAGGRADDLTAILTAASPKHLIDQLTTQRVMASAMSAQLREFRRVQQETLAIETASAVSAAAAKAAADEAAALQADLKSKQSQLKTRVAVVSARHAMLSHDQQAVVKTPPSLAALGVAAPIPLVGMNGLVPNARSLVEYVIATYPGVQSIGGVRSDPLPDHPSGRAIDIMTGSNMALGDAINADIQSQAGRFGVSYTMWRVANHFNHVHVTVY